MTTDVTETSSRPWIPGSWRAYATPGMPHYADEVAGSEAVAYLSRLPPLVTSWEILSLKRHLAEAQEGRRFLLLGGDSLERFADAEAGLLANRLKVLLQMSLLMAHGLQRPVIRVGGFAGQYACMEIDRHGGFVCHGDIVSSTADSAPDPHRMPAAHVHAALAMNFIRALIDGGFTDMDQLEHWNLAWMAESSVPPDLHSPVKALHDALQFMGAWSGYELNDTGRAELFYAHDALLLPYEECCTRQVPRHEGWFNLSTHLPRLDALALGTRGAHVEYLRGLNNPLAVHFGEDLPGESLLALIEALNPHNEAGRVVLIHRLGASSIGGTLPALLTAVREAGRRVLWVCDPMSGNTVTTSTGQIRFFDAIKDELSQAIALHAAAGSSLGGVHLDLTGENVSECAERTSSNDDATTPLPRAAASRPRLNYRQSMELAMLIVQRHQHPSFVHAP